MLLPQDGSIIKTVVLLNLITEVLVDSEVLPKARGLHIRRLGTIYVCINEELKCMV